MDPYEPPRSETAPLEPVAGSGWLTSTAAGLAASVVSFVALAVAGVGAGLIGVDPIDAREGVTSVLAFLCAIGAGAFVAGRLDAASWAVAGLALAVSWSLGFFAFGRAIDASMSETLVVAPVLGLLALPFSCLFAWLGGRSRRRRGDASPRAISGPPE